MSSEKDAASGLSQLGVRLFAESNSWTVNVTPNLITVRQMLTILSQLAAENVLTQPSVLFSVGFRNKFQVPNFQNYSNMTEENLMYQQL